MSSTPVHQTWSNDRVNPRFAGVEYPMRTGPDAVLEQYSIQSTMLAQAMREAGENAPYFCADWTSAPAPVLKTDTISVVFPNGHRYEWASDSIGPPTGDPLDERFNNDLASGMNAASIVIQFRAEHPNSAVVPHELPVSYCAYGDWGCPVILHTDVWNDSNVDEFTALLVETFATPLLADGRERKLMERTLRLTAIRYLQGRDMEEKAALSYLLSDFEFLHLYHRDPVTVHNDKFALTLTPMRSR